MHVKCDMLYVACYMWHVICDMLNVACALGSYILCIHIINIF